MDRAFRQHRQLFKDNMIRNAQRKHGQDLK